MNALPLSSKAGVIQESLIDRHCEGRSPVAIHTARGLLRFARNDDCFNQMFLHEITVMSCVLDNAPRVWAALPCVLKRTSRARPSPAQSAVHRALPLPRRVWLTCGVLENLLPRFGLMIASVFPVAYRQPLQPATPEAAAS